jgi:uncharacterized protein YeaO (DUF488 family)
MPVYLKRLFEPVSEEDGTRVLIDRLWPRGIAKDRANWQYWLKDVAPSPELRTWFSHRADRFELFRIRYEQELATDPKGRVAVSRLKKYAESGNLTLLYAAKDESCNHAIILRDWLDKT